MAALAPSAAAKHIGTIEAWRGVALTGSAYRYETAASGRERSSEGHGDVTLVERIERDGGRVDRSWILPPGYFIPATAHDGSSAALAPNGRSLVLVRRSRVFPPPRTRLAVLDTGSARRELDSKSPGRDPRVRYRALRGDYSVKAVSPDGATIYLEQRFRPVRFEGIQSFRSEYVRNFRLRALNVASGRLHPGFVGSTGENSGLPISSAREPGGRWNFTLYDGAGEQPPFIEALDTIGCRAFPIEFRDLLATVPPSQRLRIRLRMRAPHHLELLGPRGTDAERLDVLMRLDVRNLEGRSGGCSRRGARAPASAKGVDEGFLDFAFTPSGRPGNVLMRSDTAGRSAAGRPIELAQYGDPSLPGELLVFGCVHGDECAAEELRPLALFGCPDPHSDIYVVPNLNPDGAADGSRLNGRGVDLNRNFPTGWRPIRERGDPEFSGPRPFSEPEARLAARIAKRVRPEATIWFHQSRSGGPFVRAWGGSVGIARRFADLAELPLEKVPWPAGAAPNWQNHRFPDSASFVVATPRGKLPAALRHRLERAMVYLGREVGRG